MQRGILYRIFVVLALVWLPLDALAGDQCVRTSRLLREENPTLMTKTSFKTPIHNQCNLGTCWLHASLAESEGLLAYFGHSVQRLSVDFFYKNVLSDWYVKAISDPNNAPPGLDTGGEERNYDVAVQQHGLMTADAFPQMNPRRWETINRQVSAQVDVYKQQYAAATNAKGRAAVMKQANQWFADYMAKNVPQMPGTFTYEGQTYTPQQFAKKLGLTGSGQVTEYVVNASDAKLYTDSSSGTQVFNQVSREQVIGLLKTNVDLGLKVRAGVNWTSRLEDNPDAKGVLDYTVYSGTRSQAGHEITLVGYKQNANGDVVGVMIQNSWGRSNGKNGYYYVDMPTFWTIFRSLSVRANIASSNSSAPRISRNLRLQQLHFVTAVN